MCVCVYVRVCVCMCVCVKYVLYTLILFHTITVVDYLRLTKPTLSQIYVDSYVSLAIRRHLFITTSVFLTSFYPVGPRYLSLVSH